MAWPERSTIGLRVGAACPGLPHLSRRSTQRPQDIKVPPAFPAGPGGESGGQAWGLCALAPDAPGGCQRAELQAVCSLRSPGGRAWGASGRGLSPLSSGQGGRTRSCFRELLGASSSPYYCTELLPSAVGKPPPCPACVCPACRRRGSGGVQGRLLQDPRLAEDGAILPRQPFRSPSPAMSPHRTGCRCMRPGTECPVQPWPC